jgi:hypothetical protein
LSYDAILQNTSPGFALRIKLDMNQCQNLKACLASLLIEKSGHEPYLITGILPESFTQAPQLTFPVFSFGKKSSFSLSTARFIFDHIGLRPDPG